MAAILQTPVDRLTGIPLPIAPKCEWLPIDQNAVADPHHGWHPRSAPELRIGTEQNRTPSLRGLAGFALRNSWLQIVERDLHNEGPLSYHAYYSGPLITTGIDDIFSRLVLVSAGLIPEDVIDINNGDPYRRRATAKEAEFLRTPSDADEFGYRYIQYRYEPVREFFRRYVLTRKIGEEHVRKSYLDEFFFTNKPDRKMYLGHFLIVKAAEVASDQVGAKYGMLRKAGLLHPAMPTAPHTLVKYKLGNDGQRTELIPTLEDALRRQYELDAA